MIVIAKAGGCEIYAPSDTWFVSFFSSPYPPHVMSRALDLSTSFEFGDEALSPVEGIVEKIVRFDAGPGPYSKYDYVLLLRSGTRWVKIMHVEPCVAVNEKVFVGDPIGRYIRTNFFDRHHAPHMHIEVLRDRSLRPSRAFVIEPSPEFLELMSKRCVDASKCSSMKLRTVYACDEYTFLEPVEMEATCLATNVKDTMCVVNAMISRATPYVGLIKLREEGKIKPGAVVRFLGVCLGYVAKIRQCYAIVLPTRVRYDEWFWNYVSLRNMARNPVPCTTKSIDVYVDTCLREVLELLISMNACVKIDECIEDSYVNLVLREAV